MDLLEHLIARPGETQEGRLPEGLARGFVQVEGRSSRDLYRYLRSLSQQLSYHYVSAGVLRNDLDWEPFFPPGKLPANRDGANPPHLALLAAFLKLHRIPRAVMNGFTARHLEFYYRRVLGFEPRGPKADRAHVLVELKKTVKDLRITPQYLFTAGKDENGAEQLYAPLFETVMNRARVEKLCSAFVDKESGGTVRFAPVANSADGLGGEIEAEVPKWRAFGHRGLAAAPVGFALASPVLRMKEGTRKVTVELGLDGQAGLADSLKHRLKAFVTAPKRWLGPYDVEASQSPGLLSLSFTVLAADDAVADYDPAKHELAFSTRLPVVQFLLETEPHGYADLQSLRVVSAKILVDVSGVKTLQLESSAGGIDPKRTIHPFGAQPYPGARFMVGYAEALSKKLDELALDLQWLGVPDFATLYQDYETPRPKREDFTIQVTLRDVAGRELSPEEERPLFDSPLTITPGEPKETPSPLKHIAAFGAGGSRLMQQAWLRETRKRPMFRIWLGPQGPRAGFVTLKLEGDFRHGEYRRRLMAGDAPNREPYTPTLGSVSLSYKASASEQVDSADEGAFTGAEVELYHVGAFGQRREHRWLREKLPFVGAKRVPLVPEYPDEGELLIGLAGIDKGDSASLLFKAAEGSADPGVDPQPEVSWAVLCDNYWKPLAGREAVRDGTNNVLETGIVNFVIPPEAGTLSTFFPPGLVWVKAAIHENAHGVCELVSVAANAVEVERRSGGSTALPPGKIAKLKTPATAVKGVTQPFAGFGGRAPESPDAFNTRVAERLRHRNRCITAWDYERSVLEAFPAVRKVKCIPHCANRGEWTGPGHVTIVVVPDLRNRNAVDPLQPRCDAGTLDRIHDHLVPRAPMGIGIHVRNPRYERVRLDFKVAFRAGLEFNYHAKELRAAITQHLSPWTIEPGLAIEFGSTVYRSAVLDFIEDLTYVDYLTDFRMHHLRGGPDDTADVSEARATTPDAILVSDASHDIAPVT